MEALSLLPQAMSARVLLGRIAFLCSLAHRGWTRSTCTFYTQCRKQDLAALSKIILHSVGAWKGEAKWLFSGQQNFISHCFWPSIRPKLSLFLRVLIEKVILGKIGPLLAEVVSAKTKKFVSAA